MFTLIITIGLSSFFAGNMYGQYGQTENTLIDKNIAEYQCTFEGGVKEIKNNRAVCND